MNISQILAATLIASTAVPAFAATLGARALSFHARERGADVEALFWYPSDAAEPNRTLGENGIFHGQAVHWEADLPEGIQPLVVISHGAGGNAAQYTWLAEALVDKGFVVAGINHPGSSSGNSSAEEAVKLWQRPADVSALLDGLAADEQMQSLIDLQQVSMFGFSAGGYTSLALAGARIDVDKLHSFCDQATGMSDCAYLRHGGVDLHAMDLDLAGRDNSDARIKAFVAVDPGVATTLTDASLASINAPVALIGLGAEGTIPPVVDAARAATLIPGVEYARISDAVHFSFLPQCKPKGAAILAEEGEPDALCDDAGGRPRAALHSQLAQMISQFFVEQLPAQ